MNLLSPFVFASSVTNSTSLVLETEILDGFADEIAVLVGDVAELRVGNAYEQSRSLGVVKRVGFNHVS